MKQTIAVNDANILIDFCDIGLVDALARLDLVLWTSDLVISEIQIPEQRNQVLQFIATGHLLVATFSAAEIGKIALRPNALLTYRTHLSFVLIINDLAVCVFFAAVTCLLLLLALRPLHSLLRAIQNDRLVPLEVGPKFLRRGERPFRKQVGIPQRPLQNLQAHRLITLGIRHIQVEHKTQKIIGQTRL